MTPKEAAAAMDGNEYGREGSPELFVCDRPMCKLRRALAPFARAATMSTQFDGVQWFAVLSYAPDAVQTISLSALDDAKAALAGGGEG